MKKAWQIGIVVAILILFPLVSILFLWGGYQERLEAMDEWIGTDTLTLQAEWPALQAEAFHTDSLKGEISLVMVGALESETGRSLAERLYEQFGDTPDFNLISFENRDQALPNWEVKAGNLLFLEKRDDIASRLQDATSHFEGSCQSQRCPWVFLMDRDGVLLNYYATEQEEGQKELVKHTAVLLAKPRKFEKPELRRDKEM